MVSDQELSELEKEAAQEKLAQIRSELKALKNNQHVRSFAAEEYIDEAIKKLDSATIDVDEAEV
jgi:hypothetical protein